MPVYTIHAPSALALREDAERFVFLRDGFHFWAMLLGPFWLLRHRLWLVLLGYLAASAALGAAMALLGAPSNARALVFVLLAVLMGLEAATLRRWSYSRGKWQLIDFVVADDEEAAERRFFDRWIEGPQAGLPTSYHTPGGLPPVRTMPSGSQSIIGLFPEPGGSR